MARPLMQHGVAQLEQLFAKSKLDLKVLRQLEHELQYRQVPRAVALLAEVQAAMHLAAPGAPSVPPPLASPNRSALQPDLYEPPSVPPVTQPPETAARQPPPRDHPVVKLTPVGPTSSQPPVWQPDMALLMSIDEAYKVLKATPGSTWESIEQTRRRLVQQAHPEHLASMSVEKRAQIQAEAKRANSAYAVLNRHRIGAD